MSETEGRRPNPWPPVVRTILEDARKLSGSGAQFAADLEAEGVGPDTGRYSESAVSNWVKGRTMPPADVLLAAAKLGGISVDERITGREPVVPVERVTELEDIVDVMRRELDRLRSDLIELYGRLGVPMPERTEAEATPAARRRVG